MSSNPHLDSEHMQQLRHWMLRELLINNKLTEKGMPNIEHGNRLVEFKYWNVLKELPYTD